MHKTISNLIDIQKEIQSNNLDLESKIRIIAVSKTFSMENISPLIEYGHLDFGENITRNKQGMPILKLDPNKLVR